MRSETNENPKFKNMQGKAAIIAIVALLVIAAAVFMFVPAPGTPKAPQETSQASGTETASSLSHGTLDADAEESEVAAYADAADEQTAEERLAAAAQAEAAEASEEAREETGVSGDAPADETPATADSADAAPRTADAEEVESLLNAPKALTVNILRATDDRVLGRDDAPITVIEYASMTCPHCAKFHNEILPAVKRDLIATGKIRMIVRDYPIDNYALRAAMMARCAPNEKYFDLVEVLFKNQTKWTKSDNPLRALAQYGNLAGMDDEFITSCMTNAELEAALLKRQRDAQTLYRIRSTPTFVFNVRGQENVRQLVGPDNAQQFTEIVDKLLNAR